LKLELKSKLNEIDEKMRKIQEEQEVQYDLRK